MITRHRERLQSLTKVRSALQEQSVGFVSRDRFNGLDESEYRFMGSACAPGDHATVWLPGSNGTPDLVATLPKTKWKVKNIVLRDFSLYISFGYWWLQCSAWSANQFRFVNGRLAMTGNASAEKNIDEGVTVKSSTNLMTGQGYWISEKNWIEKQHPDNSIGRAKPLSDPGEALNWTIFSERPKQKARRVSTQRASA